MEDTLHDGESPIMETIKDRRRRLEEGRIEPSIVIPVNRAFPLKQRVLTDHQVRDILRRSDAVAATECGCRAIEGNCDSPRDVCIILGETAATISEREGWDLISIEEAMEVLERSADAGLVHLSLWAEGHVPDAICSCCSCCCHELRALVELGYTDQVISSDFVADYDADACTGCGNCAERCNFGAFIGSEDGVSFDHGRCFGCGVCVTTCPSGAIALVERR